MRLAFALLVWVTSAGAAELLVAAASDLIPLEARLKAEFAARTGHSLRFSFGSSGLLARQIENGAPFDVYLSANERFVHELAKAGALEAGSVRAYATGRVGLWSADGKIKELKQLASLRHIAMPNPQHAPYGVAAEEALRRSGLWQAVRGKLVLGENVRQAFEFARSGNADAVLTSWTLLFDKGGVLLPETLHAPVRQSGAITRVCRQREAARAFLEYLGSAEGRKTLAAYGLGPAR